MIMKTKTLLLILFMAIFSVAQASSSFDNDWKKVEDFDKKSLPKSALAVVDNIFARAVKENNSPQVIKALMYKIGYQRNCQCTEEEWPQIFSVVEKMTAESTDNIEQAMLHSMLAEMYLQFYQENTHRINQRTPIVGYVPENMNEWSKNIFTDKMVEHISASLLPKTELLRAQVTTYSDILHLGNDSRHLRPTMFDFLSYRALDLLSGEEFIPKNLDETFFAPAKDFMKIPVTDNNADKQIQIYQNLLKAHADNLLKAHTNGSEDAFLYADLERLRFVYTFSFDDNRDSLYLNSLSVLEKQFQNNPLSVEIMIEKANFYMENTRNLQGEEANELLGKALAICEEGIKKFPNYSRINALANIKMQITQPSLSAGTRELVYPQTEIIFEISYKNLKNATLKIYKVEKNIETYIAERFNDRQSIMGKLISTQQIEFPQTMPFVPQTHSVTINGLEYGIYQYEIVSKGTTGNPQKGDFFVSKFALIQRQRTNELEYFVVDRMTGQPVPKASVRLFESKYENRRQTLNPLATIASDKNGFVSYQYSKIQTVYAGIAVGDDKNFPLNSLWTNNWREQEERRLESVSIFTDRSVYRPGQTVYFKAIAYNRTATDVSVMKNKTLEVKLFDANWQEINKLSLKTNEFGSISGSFILPQNVLSGNFNIQVGNQNHSILVEEYKRPSIEININNIQGAYTFGDTISLTGNVMNYAGFASSNADLTYRIVEQTRFWGFRMPPFSEREITNGTLTANQQGEFSLSFVPQKRRNNRFNSQNYTLHIESTDSKGETQRQEFHFSVSENSIQLNTNLSARVKKEDKTDITVTAVNNNGEKINTIITYQIFRLQPSLLNSPQEDFPDGRSQAQAVLPLEGKLEGAAVLSGTIDLSKTNKILVANTLQALPSGRYRLVLTATDEKGRKNSTTRDFVLFSEKDKKLADKEYIFIHRQKTECAVGENAEILFGTSANNVKVLFQLLKGEELLESKWLDFDNELRMLNIPFKAEYGDHVTLELSFMKDQQFFTERVEITKKQENRALDIKFTTFRDKLLPGQQEEWTIKITDSKGKIVNAELLATMFDASLDMLRPNKWNFAPSPYNPRTHLNFWSAPINRRSSIWLNFDMKFKPANELAFDNLNWFNAFRWNRFGMYRGVTTSSEQLLQGRVAGLSVAKDSGDPNAQIRLRGGSSVRDDADVFMMAESAPMMARADKEVDNFAGFTAFDDSADLGATPNINIRQNFAETAFFFPQLKTNKDGEVLLSFTMPESLTRWNFMGLAHTVALQYGQLSASVITQKSLMITANVPRFVRVNDKMVLTANVANLTEKPIKGQAILEVVNPIDEKIIVQKTVDFNVAGSPLNLPQGDLPEGQNQAQAVLPLEGKLEGATTTVSWNYDVTEQYDMLIFRVIAKSNDFSDGEQHLVPVLSEKVLVTESMRMNMRGEGTEDFTFERMKNADSPTLQTRRFTVEFTANPVWYAVQAIPYLSTPTNENAISLFSAYYANMLGSYIVNANPKIKSVFELWKKQDISKNAFLSALETNQELKNILLQETPWVMDAQCDSERKQRLALLFDLNNLANSTASMFDKLSELQLTNGAFPWFNGMREDRYVTLFVLDGMAKLNKIGIESQAEMQRRAISFIDFCIKDDFERLKRNNKNYKTETSVSPIQIYYHYVRSSYTDIPIPNDTREAFNFYRDLMEKQWTKQNLYGQAQTALVMNRASKKSVANDILKSLRENSRNSDELGMFWGTNRNGYFWNQSAIKTQSALIEAFAEIANNKTEIDEMKIWLLKQKQTQIWDSEISTINAVYALLMQGSDWTADNIGVTVKVGGNLLDDKAEAGAGHIQKTFTGNDITPKLADISVTKTGGGIAWGAAYWQYLENIDKIEKQQGSLSIDKKLFVERMNSTGRFMEPLSDKSFIKIGDKVTVRLTVNLDRDMEYLALKDMRASCFEPVEQLSGFRWREGVGFYQTTRDASVQYFFNFLPRGTYVFEYQLWVSRAGEYSNGIANIQCLYAPEFVSHSANEKVIVK